MTMKSRQPIGSHDHVTAWIPGTNECVVVRFRPDQRKTAKLALIKQAFLRGWVIPMEHHAFTLIDVRTWEPVK